MINKNIFYLKKIFSNKKKHIFNYNNKKVNLIIKKTNQLIINKHHKIKCKTNCINLIFFNIINYNSIIIDKKNIEYSNIFIKLKGNRLTNYFNLKKRYE